MRKPVARGWMVVLAVILAIGLLLASTRSVVAPQAAIPAETAARQALAAGRDTGLGGYLAPPERILGMQMRFIDALRFVFGANVGEDRSRPDGYPVWLVVLEGEFIEHVPAAPPDIPAKDVTHSQMALLIDAQTGEAFESMLISPQHPLDTRSLPVLPRPGE